MLLAHLIEIISLTFHPLTVSTNISLPTTHVHASDYKSCILLSWYLRVKFLRKYTIVLAHKKEKTELVFLWIVKSQSLYCYTWTFCLFRWSYILLHFIIKLDMHNFFFLILCSKWVHTHPCTPNLPSPTNSSRNSQLCKIFRRKKIK
jgi:hypothetical protein